MDEILPVPKREFLRTPDDGNKRNSADVLPSKVPIIGLGCSSFSTFFFTKEELQGESSNSANDGEDKSNIAASITADSLTRDHPKVQEWID